MPITLYTTSGAQIQAEDKPISAAGAEGSVHFVLNGLAPPKYCVKLYHAARRTDRRRQKLEFMVNHKPGKLLAPSYIICWPTELVFDAKRNFAGFIMARAFEQSETLYELTTIKRSARLKAVWNKFDRSTAEGMIKRLKICVNIAIAVDSIHQTHKYAIIDYKPQNILINEVGKISVIDVDSFQVVYDLARFNSEMSTPEYAPPESKTISPTTNILPLSWDRFALAISYYEILFGIHPYSATCDGALASVTTISDKIQHELFVHGANKGMLTIIPPVHNDFWNLPVSIRNLFLRAFESPKGNPGARPSAEEWGTVIMSALNDGASIKQNTPYVGRKKAPAIVVPPVRQPSVITSAPALTWWDRLVRWWKELGL